MVKNIKFLKTGTGLFNMNICQKELTKEFTITTNLRDCYDNLKISSILDLTQEIASLHADILHVGFNDFYKNNLIWVIVRNKFEIVSECSNLSKVKVKTYPLKNNLVEYPRDYEIYDENDQLIIKGRSIWMIYDLTTKNVTTPKLDIFDEGQNGVFTQRIRRLPKPIKNEKDFDSYFYVKKSLLDHNNHLNNSHCADLFLDLFNPESDLKIESFQMEYVSQCFLNDKLSIYKHKEGNKYLIYAYLDDVLKFYFEVKCNK